MSGRPASARTPWGGVELLERAISYARGSLALVTPALLSARTPCAEWDLETLLAHMHDSLTSLHEAGSVRRVGLDGPTTAPVDLVDALRARACELLADWSTQTGAQDILVEGRPITSRVLTSAGALEVTVHGWDVATACGAHRPIPDLLAADLLRVAPCLVCDADRPGRFEAPQTPPHRPSSGDELLAFLGRHP